jgi:hypothetical protein
MTTLSTTTRNFEKDMVRRAAALKDTIKALVKSLPPNPGLQRLGKNCGVVSSSLLMQHSNWSPSYWLNNEMQTRLCEIIDKSRPENLRKNIVTILRQGSYETGYKQTMRIHPAALKALRQAWLWPAKTTTPAASIA